MSVTSRLGPRARHIVDAGSGTLLGNATGVLLPFMITIIYGSGRLTDGYFLAAASANFVVILTASTEGVSIPYFVRVRAAHGAGGGRVTGQLLRRGVGLSVALLVPAYAITGVLVVPHGGFSPGQRGQVLLLLVVLSPLPLAAAASSVFASAHYAYGRFWLPTATQALRSSAALLCVLGGAAGVPLVVAAGALTVGELLRAAILLTRLPCARPAPGDLLLREPLECYRSTALPAVLSMVIVCVNPLIDKAVAGSTGPAGITTLELAEKLFYVPTILFGGMVASVLASDWASVHQRTGCLRAVAPDFWRTQRLVLGGATGLTLVATAVAAIVGPGAAGLLRLPSGTQFALVLCLYLAGLPATFFIEVSGRLVTTLRVNQIMPWLSGLAVVLNLVLDLLGRELFGLAGIALSTTLVRFVGAGVLFWWVRRSFAREPANPLAELAR